MWSVGVEGQERGTPLLLPAANPPPPTLPFTAARGTLLTTNKSAARSNLSQATVGRGSVVHRVGGREGERGRRGGRTGGDEGGR